MSHQNTPIDSNYLKIRESVVLALYSVARVDPKIIQNLSDEESFYELKIIDSLAMIELVSFIENQLNLTIDANDITMENFQSIGNIVNLIRAMSKSAA